VAERTVTLAEAAELTGLTRKALQRRIDRGSLRSVLSGGRRRIPVSELHRANLAPAAADPDSPPEGLLGVATGEGRPAAPGRVGDGLEVRELLDRLERQAAELGELRALTRGGGPLEAQVEAERRGREAAEAALHEARARIRELERGPRVGTLLREGRRALARLGPRRRPRARP
jgi:excisionase family DNA binding protein